MRDACRHGAALFYWAAMPWQVIALPLIGALAYALSATLLKRVSRSNVDPWRITCCTNFSGGALMQWMWLLPHNERAIDWTLPRDALLPAALFTGGQVLTVLAIHTGDVSVATPLMGAKVLFVAGLTVLLLQQSLSWQLWAAAALATIAVAMLRGRTGQHHFNVGRTILYALGASFLFALTDVLVQRLGTPWGAARFAPTLFGLVTLLTMPMMLLFEKASPSLLIGSRRILVVATLFYCLQLMSLAYTLAEFGHAAMVNILYSSRGIWGVVLAWTIGPLVGLYEHSHGRGVFFKRMAAAMLIIAAIGLALARGTG